MCNNNDDNNYKNDLFVSESKLNMNDNFAEIIWETAKKNSDWSRLPLSDNFMKKYNSKDGILKGDEGITSIKYSNESNRENNIVVLRVAHNLKYEDYYIHYYVDSNNNLDDVELTSKVMDIDESGVEVVKKKLMDEGDYISNIELLAAPYRGERNNLDFVYLTDKYYSKWGKGFVNNRGQDIFYIESIKALCNFQNQIVYLKCDYPEIGADGWPLTGEPIDELSLYYKVHYIINSDFWLDDVEVEEVSKAEIDRLLANIKG